MRPACFCLDCKGCLQVFVHIGLNLLVTTHNGSTPTPTISLLLWLTCTHCGPELSQNQSFNTEIIRFWAWVTLFWWGTHGPSKLCYLCECHLPEVVLERFLVHSYHFCDLPIWWIWQVTLSPNSHCSFWHLMSAIDCPREAETVGVGLLLQLAADFGTASRRSESSPFWYALLVFANMVVLSKAQHGTRCQTVQIA